MKGQGCHLRKTGRWLPNDHTGEEKDNFQEALVNDHLQGHGEGGGSETFQGTRKCDGNPTRHLTRNCSGIAPE